MKAVPGYILLLAAIAWLAPATAGAANITKCTDEIRSLPVTLLRAGVYCVKQNLTTTQTSGFAIRIAHSNITVDLGGFQISSKPAHSDAKVEGIFARSKHNVTVRNGTIKGFLRGVSLREFAGRSSGHLVENVRVVEPVLTGLRVEGDAIIVRDNQIILRDTEFNEGGPGAYGIYIANCNGASVSGNKITRGRGFNPLTGITMNACTGSIISNNHISSGNGADSVVGISFETGIHTIIGNRIYKTEGIDQKGANGACIRNIVLSPKGPMETKAKIRCAFKHGNVLQ